VRDGSLVKPAESKDPTVALAQPADSIK